MIYLASKYNIKNTVNIIYPNNPNMAQRISEALKSKILKSVEDDGLPVAKASKEYGVHHKTIYNWLNKNVEGNGGTNASYGEIKKLKRDKDDLLLIIGELTAEINLSKKKKLK